MGGRTSFRPGPTELYRTGRHPARCNRRDCQARRTLSKHPALYREWPRCRCGGRLYVDWYRLKKGPRDNAPVCKARGSCPHPVPVHRVSSEGCAGYNDWITARNTAPRSRHSPIPPGEWVPF